jgi:intein/homing endonuclease
VLAHNSIVYTDKCLVKIQTIAKNSLVTYNISTVDKKDKILHIPIVDVMCVGKQQVYELSTENGTFIRTTADQKIYTNLGWKELSHIHEGDAVAVRIDFAIPPLKTFNSALNTVTKIELGSVVDVYKFTIKSYSIIHYGFINGILTHDCE